MKISHVSFFLALISFCSFANSLRNTKLKMKQKTSVCCCDIFTAKGPKEIGWKSLDGTCDYIGCITSKKVCSNDSELLVNDKYRYHFTDNIYRKVPGTKPCCCTMKVAEKKYDVHWAINVNGNTCKFTDCEKDSSLSDEDCSKNYATTHRATWTNIDA